MKFFNQKKLFIISGILLVVLILVNIHYYYQACYLNSQAEATSIYFETTEVEIEPVSQIEIAKNAILSLLKFLS